MSELKSDVYPQGSVEAVLAETFTDIAGNDPFYVVCRHAYAVAQEHPEWAAVDPRLIVDDMIARLPDDTRRYSRIDALPSIDQLGLPPYQLIFSVD